METKQNLREINPTRAKQLFLKRPTMFTFSYSDARLHEVLIKQSSGGKII